MAGLTHSPLSDFQGSGVANASTVINGDSLEDASSSSFLGGGGETRRNSLSNPPKQALSVDVPEDTKDSEAEADAPELLYTPLSEGWKKIVVIIAGVTGMLAPFCSNIFLPALHIVADDLNSTVERINVAVSVFMIGLGVAPIFWGPMADQFGRRYSYSLGCLVCALASVGCALAESDSLLLGMRFLQAFGGSATIVVGAGSISDVYEPAQRGGALGVFFSAQMLGPVLGTIIGGYVAENLGWRWTFWLSVIISGVFCAIVTFIMPETHRVTMARRYQMPLKGLPADIHLKPRPPITLQQINPFAIAPTLKFKYVSLPTLCTALIFGSFYSMNTAVSTILADQYHYSTSNIGLCYIAIGVGCISGALIGGIMADKNYTRLLR
ncbi:major facilitator superfamily domain-containing protein, partial [Dimargaris cristalligena]